MGNRQPQPRFRLLTLGATATEPTRPVLVSSVASKNRLRPLLTLNRLRPVSTGLNWFEVTTGQNRFFEATEPTRTGLVGSVAVAHKVSNQNRGCGCPQSEQPKPWLRLPVAHFGAKKPDRTGLSNTRQMILIRYQSTEDETMDDPKDGEPNGWWSIKMPTDADRIWCAQHPVWNSRWHDAEKRWV